MTARPPSALQTSLAACIKNHCGPEEDIAATLAYAAFVAGDYKPARSALGAAIGRDKDAAAERPEAASDLYRTHATVSKHLGEVDTYRLGTWHIARTAKYSPKASVEERLAARVEVADMPVSIADPSGQNHTLGTRPPNGGKRPNFRHPRRGRAALKTLAYVFKHPLTGPQL